MNSLDARSRTTPEERECRSRIREDLLRLGVAPGGVLLVHSSFKSLGPAPGGIDTLIGALLDALGPGGTLLMPGFSWLSVTRQNPCFHVRDTPCCVGAVPSRFMELEGTVRSMHPTHSFCGQGPRVEELFKDHIHDTTPCGANSPITKLRFMKGQVLMLGCGLRPNTTMHAVEEEACAPYLFEDEPVEYTLVGYDGRPIEVRHRRHAAFAQHYDRIAPELAGGGLAQGGVLDARCHLMDAGALWACASEMLRKDILCFARD